MKQIRKIELSERDEKVNLDKPESEREILQDIYEKYDWTSLECFLQEEGDRKIEPNSESRRTACLEGPNDYLDDLKQEIDLHKNGIDNEESRILGEIYRKYDWEKFRKEANISVQELEEVSISNEQGQKVGENSGEPICKKVAEVGYEEYNRDFSQRETLRSEVEVISQDKSKLLVRTTRRRRIEV